MDIVHFAERQQFQVVSNERLGLDDSAQSIGSLDPEVLTEEFDPGSD
jgi:hypothetical protein